MIMDEFRDEGGIDTATSTNESYDSADFYTNDTTSGVAGTDLEDDDGNTGHTVTINNDVTVNTSTKKFGASSANFQGSNDYFSMADHADWNFGSGNFTIDFWINLETTNTNSFWEQYDDTSNFVFFRFEGSALGPHFQVRNGGSDIIEFYQGNKTGWSADTWYHVAVIRGWNGNANDYAITQDGVPVATLTDTDSIPNMTAQAIIGVMQEGTDFAGYMDEFRVSNTARWTSDFSGSLPSSEYTSDSNTKLLMHMNEVAATSGTTHDTTLISNTTVAESQPDQANIVMLVENSRSEERRVGKECRSRWSPYH